MLARPVLMSMGVWFWLLICNVVDTYATKYLITNGWAVELNPFANWLILNVGYTGLLMFKLTCVILLLVPLLLYAQRTHKLSIFTNIITAVYTVVVMYQMVKIAELSFV